MRSFFLFLIVVALAACTGKREACLDIEATNFDAAADKNCCCTYPNLLLKVTPQFGAALWKPDTAYEYAPGKWFRLRQVVYYLSDFQLVRQGVSIPVSDTLSLPVWGSAGDTSTQTLTNDILLIRRSADSYKAGTFRTSGAFESVRFRVGLPDAAQRVIPDLAPSGHPLRQQSEKLWLGRDTGYVALQLILTRDTLSGTAPDTLRFHRPDFDYMFIQKDSTFQHESGYDFILLLSADYRELFQGVDLSSGDISTWKAQIAANLPKALRVTQ